jgi:hypothetical protein
LPYFIGSESTCLSEAFRYFLPFLALTYFSTWDARKDSTKIAMPFCPMFRPFRGRRRHRGAPVGVAAFHHVNVADGSSTLATTRAPHSGSGSGAVLAARVRLWRGWCRFAVALPRNEPKAARSRPAVTRKACLRLLCGPDPSGRYQGWEPLPGQEPALYHPLWRKRVLGNLAFPFPAQVGPIEPRFRHFQPSLQCQRGPCLDCSAQCHPTTASGRGHQWQP